MFKYKVQKHNLLAGFVIFSWPQSIDYLHERARTL